MARPERLLAPAGLALRAAGKAGVLRSLRSLVELSHSICREFEPLVYR